MDIHVQSGDEKIALERFDVIQTEDYVDLRYREGQPSIPLTALAVKDQPMLVPVGTMLIPGFILRFSRAQVPGVPGAPKSNAKAHPGKMGGTGNLMRDGKVVRDNPTPESDAQDREYEKGYRDMARGVVRRARSEGRSNDEIVAVLGTMSFRPDTALQIIQETLIQTTSGSSSSTKVEPAV